jgi:transcriptional regulator with XRE-family HTH domain
LLLVGRIRDQILLKKIAKGIKALREEAGVTQEVFIYDTNIHIGRIELAQINVTVSTLNAICRYFDVSLAEFFKRVES